LHDLSTKTKKGSCMVKKKGSGDPNKTKVSARQFGCEFKID